MRVYVQPALFLLRPSLFLRLSANKFGLMSRQNSVLALASKKEVLEMHLAACSHKSVSQLSLSFVEFTAGGG